MTVNMAEHDYLFKIIIIGDSGCGKSSVLTQYVDKVFLPNFIATIGVDFKIKTIEKNDKKIKLQIWDTAGQERFRTITNSYYRGAHAVILAYDGYNKESFDHLNTWFEDCNKLCQSRCVKFLIGCKYDFNPKEDLKVTVAQAQQWANRNGISFLQTSAKDNLNIDDMFTTLCDEISQRIHINNKSNFKRIDSQSIKLLPAKPKTSSTCC